MKDWEITSDTANLEVSSDEKKVIPKTGTREGTGHMLISIWD